MSTVPKPSIADATARHALGLPETWEDHPWEGDRVAKVGKKIFAFLAGDDGGTLGVKLPHSAGYALSLPCATPMGYGLGRHGWITLTLDHPSTPDVALLRDWIEESYRAVAPKRLSRGL
jgi:predicted DNA-binding protein (MmcQ/YjbR family)